LIIIGVYFNINMNIESLDINQNKFDTCKFRSSEEISRIIKRCSCQGGDYETKGFYCEERQLFQITKEICATCPVYESK
jgi:hypothetical protein